ncbi:hybrid sensor histidine kinase/response regulator [Leptospira langatensis]|uniref:Hybrid sensor histidine kinase/response regulator n=1 Tax=Leptospira langatensis TaxID=2484983 RepID=A0A5F2A0A4_9LEPT|nr:response regulator [Leptospira langatensis]TGK04217.1 hybrid sensor histidine kinase/response regulator [Leptospira langatensis]TGL43697.1 hybrid sensor histidine kinase/response regulator [Leptospira langatensis]
MTNTTGSIGTPKLERKSLVRDPVLIVEDKLENTLMLEALCEEFGIQYESASNGEEALEMAKAKKYSIYIVDLLMPVMDGPSFIRRLKEFEQDAIILVQTAIDSTETVIEVMKLGVFDYIIKPIFPDLFLKSMSKAVEYKALKDRENSIIEAESLKLRSQLEWLTYKETKRKSADESWEKTSIHSLQTSLSQGSGIGAIISLLDMARADLKKEGDYYQIHSSIMDLILENQEITKNLLAGLTQLLEIINKDLNKKPMLASELVDRLKGAVDFIRPYLEQKGLRLNLPVLKREVEVEIEPDLFFSAVYEIVLNAFKYCAPKTSLELFTSINQGYFCIVLKNIVDERPYGGVEEKYESLVLQPFFRLHPPVESVSHLEKFGLGLGLTAVDQIMRKHNGLFFIHNAKDHTGDQIRLCVMSELLLPIR